MRRANGCHGAQVYGTYTFKISIVTNKNAFSELLHEFSVSRMIDAPSCVTYPFHEMEDVKLDLELLPKDALEGISISFSNDSRSRGCKVTMGCKEVMIDDHQQLLPIAYTGR